MANKNGNSKHQPATGHLGPIDPDVVYPLEVFRRLTGLGDTSLRNARRDGLTVHRYGARAFIVGAFSQILKAKSGDAPGPDSHDATGAQ